VYQALKAGARGYLLKDVPASEIVDAIRDVHAGKSHLTPAVADQVARRLTTADLTPRERQVLRLMAEGLSNKELAGRLGFAETTAEKHVGGVLHKLGARDRIQAVKLALERGILELDT
jgi:DNA-binding NarL/FixJ family response regulator